MSQITKLIFWIFLIIGLLSQPVLAKIKSHAKTNALTSTNTINGYKIIQNSQEFGQVYTLITPLGFKLKGTDVNILVKKPDYKVIFLNTKKHLIFTETIEKYNFKRDISQTHNSTIKYAVTQENNNETINNFKPNKYKYYKIKVGVRKSLICEFWTLKLPNFPQNLMDIGCQLAYIPTGYGFPLKYIRYDLHKGKYSPLYYLNTLEIKTQKIDQNEFAVPKNYTVVDSEMSVVMGLKPQKENQNIKDLFKTDY